MSVEKLNYIWPKWQVVEQLGEGSFGKVYKVVRKEHTLTSYAAVKIISIPQNKAELESMRAEGLSEHGTRSYFEGIVTDCVNEIKLMESMKGNTNVVSVEDYKVMEKSEGIGWDIFIRMELLTPLNSYIADKQLTEPEVKKIGQDVCAALHLCSQLNIIHRDIKPENIFVSPFGDFKVGDFGIARELEMSGGSLSQKGTYNYMAPEVVASKRYDATVDIYSLGLVLYKLLNNNRMPFLDPYTQLIQYQDRKNAIDRRLSGEALPAPVKASPYMAQVIRKACAFNPAERFQTPFDFREALGATKGDMSPVHAARPNFDETTAVRHAPQVAQSHPKENKRNEPTASFGRKKKSKTKIVLAPICLLLIVAGVIAGFIMNQSDEVDGYAANSNDIVYADGVDEIPEAQEARLGFDEVRVIDVSRSTLSMGVSWILDTELLPRKIDEVENGNTYTNGLRMEMRNHFRNSTLTWDVPHPYLSFDVGVTGNGGATIQIQPRNSDAIIWERTIPPGQMVNVRNLNVSDFGGITISARAANDGGDIYSWILDPILSMEEVSHGSAQDGIVSVIVDAPTPTSMPTDTPAPTNTPTPQPTEAITENEPTEAIPNDEQVADEHESGPVSLSTVEVIESHWYTVAEGLFIASSGHRYHESFIFSPNTRGEYLNNLYSYAIFNLDNRFTTFSAEVAAPSELGEHLEFLIEIAFDDIVEPVISIEDFNVTMHPVPIEIDVTGVTSMYIIVRGRGNSPHSHPGNHPICIVNTALE